MLKKCITRKTPTWDEMFRGESRHTANMESTSLLRVPTVSRASKGCIAFKLASSIYGSKFGNSSSTCAQARST